MSDPKTRSIWVDGEEYDATPEAEAELGRRGVKYRDRPPAKSDPLLGRYGDAIDAGVRGLAHGISAGLSDKVPVLGELNADSRELSPTVYDTADMVGSVVSPVNKIGKVVKGAGVLASAGREALVGGVEGAMRAFGADQNIAEGAIDGGAGGALASLGLSGLGRGASAVGKKLGGVLESSADTLRTRAAGVGAAEMKALAERFGVDKLPQSIAALIEKTVPSTGGIGRSAGDYAGELKGIRENVGPQLDEVLDRADANEGINTWIPQEWDKMKDRVQTDLDYIPAHQRVTPQQKQRVSEWENILETLENTPAPTRTADVRSGKSAWQADAHTGIAGTVPDNIRAHISEEMGHEGKKVLDGVLSAALPETQAAYKELNDKYADAALLGKFADKRASTEAANTYAPGIIAATGGGALGGLMHDDPDQGRLYGMGAGALMSLNTGTRNFLTQMLSGSRAMDTAANQFRKVAPKLKNIPPDVLDKLRNYSGSMAAFATSEDPEDAP